MDKMTLDEVKGLLAVGSTLKRISEKSGWSIQDISSVARLSGLGRKRGRRPKKSDYEPR